MVGPGVRVVVVVVGATGADGGGRVVSIATWAR